MFGEALLAWFVVLLAATVYGVTGVGFGMVAVPLLILFLDAHLVVVTVLVLSTALSLAALLQARRHISLKVAGPITLGSMLGVPLGSYLLIVLSGDLLKGLVAALAVLFSIPLLLGYSRSFRHFRLASLLTGVVSGALQSSTSMGSPPAVLFMANQGMPKEVFRGTMVLRTTVASGLAVVVLAPTGLVNQELAVQCLLLAPALLIGLAVGTRLLRLVPQRLFKQVAILLISTTAMISLMGSLF